MPTNNFVNKLHGIYVLQRLKIEIKLIWIIHVTREKSIIIRHYNLCKVLVFLYFFITRDICEMRKFKSKYKGVARYTQH